MIRTKPRSEGVTFGSESFIDVLSNTVGALALLCILAAMDAGNLRWRLFISEERPTTTRAAGLFVTADGVKRFDDARLLADVNAWERRNGGLPAEPQLLEAYAEFPYDIEIVPRGDEGALVRISDSAAFPGEPIDELLAGRGSVAEYLRGLDPSQHHVYVHLGADSFDRYIALRSWCQSLGLEMGWEPRIGPLQLSYGKSSGGAGGGGGLFQLVE